MSPNTLPDTDHVSLQPILRALARRVPRSEAALATRFAEACYRRMSADELPLHDADTWAALALGMLGAAMKRKPGQVLLRLFNPERGRDGCDGAHTVLQIVNDDMPFLVDSVTMALTDAGIGVHVLGHPVITLRRDRAGVLQSVGEGSAESFMHVELDRQTPAAMRALEARLHGVLADTRAANADWPAMRARMQAIAAELPDRSSPLPAALMAEARAFLDWVADDHFTFLGYREYRVTGRGAKRVLQAIEGTGLGVLRVHAPAPPRALSGLGAHAHGALEEPLILTKTSARSSVHRPGFMDYIGVPLFNARGEVIGEQRFVGLYTSSAYQRRPWEIPLVRQRHEQIMQAAGFSRTSHNGKALRHILETLPRDELFQADADTLQRTALGILGLQERLRSRLFLRPDRYGRFHSVLVYVPRERHSTEVRLKIEQMLLAALDGERVDSTVQVGDSPLAQLHMLVRVRPGAAGIADEATLNAELVRIVRDWRDGLRDVLMQRLGEREGLELAARFARNLPPGYREAHSPEAAADDLIAIAGLRSEHDLSMRLYRHEADAGLRFKLIHFGAPIPLSSALPMLERLALAMHAEHVDVFREQGRDITVHDFELSPQRVLGFGIEAIAPAFQDAFAAVWGGQAESDGYNALVLGAGLEWRQIAVLRAYGKYMQQIGVPFSPSYIEQTLAGYPLLARLLVELFEARFHPGTGKEPKREIATGQARLRAQFEVLAAGDAATLAALEPVIVARSGDREVQSFATREAIRVLLDRVSSLDDDRILRIVVGLIDATLRTNAFVHYADGRRRDGGPADYISLKFDCARVPDLPKPRPYREIWVCGPRVEGVHLRFGPVARGGLRWSDRREDFRTEVLGLVKAQMVKNTVIVPVGSKGGFFCKQLPDPAQDRDAWFNEGVACYQRFINGLLDITDNLADGMVVPPAGVVRHDGDDPYLVVAADKGTATFSDIANAIARAHGYWLDDAFASGGSVGYDHKGMGITARGGWESVKRHFRALGRDCQRDDFTCVGIGDMSGDVFGNGMLLSERIHLLAAFDHRHIFVDPSPDAAASFKERQRLFALPRSSWNDYDRALIGKGGGVWPRSAKAIPVSAEMRRALGIENDAAQLTPVELLRAILEAPVDLIWNGGIGTYVKAERESNGDVGDRANNAIRVNGNQLRCKLVGEGGNLGMTQLGRVEAALNGVLLNTDFIDNSAGVDTSDHEVNIKILLNAEVREKRLAMPARNTLLAAMTDEVGQLVLNDNYRQNQALSLMERMSVGRLGSMQHFIRTLEAQGRLDRQIEFLPSDAEFAERRARGLGLTRPELAVLLSYDKIVAFEQLLSSDVPEDPYLSQELERYFPTALRKRHARAMQTHRLKREIIATAVTNSTINRMGATFLLRMQEDTGRGIGEVARAFTISREVLDARDLWAAIDGLDGKVPEAVQVDALLVIWHLQRAITRWLLSRPGRIPDITAAVGRYHDGMRAIRLGKAILPAPMRPAYEASLADWQARGVPQTLAGQLAALPYLESSGDIIEVARARKLTEVDVARVHFRLGDALQLPWLYQQIDLLPVDGRWHAVARGALRDELATRHRELTAQALSLPGGDADAKVARWLGRDDAPLHFTLGMLTELAAQTSLDYPTASVAVRRLAMLAQAD